MYEQGKLDGILLGDKAYAIKPYLMKAYTDPMLPHEKRFQYIYFQTFEI